jgi:glutamine synthetase
VDVIIESGVKKDEAIFQVLKKYIVECKNIRFDGNGYSEDWVEEAARRGLTNVRNVPEALDAYLTDKVVNLFGEMGIYTPKELEGRTEVEFEKFTKKIHI